MGEKIKKIVYKALPYLWGLCAVGFVGVVALCVWSLLVE